MADGEGVTNGGVGVTNGEVEGSVVVLRVNTTMRVTATTTKAKNVPNVAQATLVSNFILFLDCVWAVLWWH